MLLELENILLKGQYEKESNVNVLKELHDTWYMYSMYTVLQWNLGCNKGLSNKQ